MKSRMQPFGVILLLIGCGCGGAGLTPVKGIVKLDGQPLPGASVVFIAQDETGRDARGGTDANGVFQLTTFTPNDGALPGKYKVIVQPPAPLVDGAPALSPLDAQTAANRGENTTKAAMVIAPRFGLADQTVLVQEVPSKGDVILDVQSK